MSRDRKWRSGGLGGDPTSVRGRRSSRFRTTVVAPVGEALEGRQLLSAFTGYVHVRHIATSSGVYSLQLSDQSILKVTGAGNGQIDVKALGTTSSTTLTISLIRPRYHRPSGLLQIRNLNINSGQIGSIDAPSALLNGAMTPLASSVSTMSFGVLGPGAQINVGGDVGSMSVGAVDLGPSGHVIIGGDLNSAIAQSSSSQTSTAAMTIGSLVIDGGQFVIGRDSLSPIVVGGDVTLTQNGLFSVGRDQTGSITVGGSLILNSGGQLMVGRNLAGLWVAGNVDVGPSAGGIVVGGNLDGVTVAGVFQGQGSPSAVDLGVGLNLTGLTILGGSANQGGLQSANINVGKNLSQIDIPHGIFRSWITAGLAIDGQGAGSTPGTVGADGTTAIYNSEIDAGTTITNMVIGGDVKSGFPTGDPTGYPTRIIAGKVRGPATGSTPDQGLYQANGTISNFIIDGSLVDAVLAASVAPYGGDGSLPPAPAYGTTPQNPGSPPGVFTNYQAPAGLTDGTLPNYSIRNVTGGVPTGPAAWAQPAGNRHDTVLNNGSITVTITGGVVSTQTNQTADTYDYAGLFAVNTVGVSS